MLSAFPALIEPTDVKFKEIKELTSIEQALFVDFLHNHNTGESIFPAFPNLPDLLHAFNNELKEEIIWVVYFQKKFVGFWFIEEKHNKLVISFFLPSGNNNSYLEKFFVGFFKTISDNSSVPVYFNAETLNSNQKHHLGLTEEDNDLVDCSCMSSEYDANVYKELLSFIKPYYM